MTRKTCRPYLDCAEEKKILFFKRGYPVWECNACGHRFVEIPDHAAHVSRVYSDGYFFDGKDGYPNYLKSHEILYEQGLRYARILARHMSAGKMLDVGSAAGFILSGFKDSGWDCVGIEPNDTMAAYGRNELQLDIRTGSIESFITRERFDAVTMIQVIGHVYDLDKTFENICRVLKPNGVVLVESWNMKSFIARIMGRAWHEYAPPSVVHWFSDKSLTRLFNSHGFELLHKGHPLKKIVGEHAFSMLETNTGNPVMKKIIRSAQSLTSKRKLIYPFFDVKYYIFRKENEATNI